MLRLALHAAGQLLALEAYAALLGYLGGKAFADNHTTAFLVAFGGAIGVTILTEVVRHYRKSSVPA